MEIARLDHVVLTVRDVAATCAFYSRVLGMRVETFGAGRTALHFGNQKINVHPTGGDVTLVARLPTPGSGDLCFITTTPRDALLAHLAACGVAVEAGPIERAGAIGPMESVYFRDPDGNLVEVSRYSDEPGR
ncbi:MAG TPA: VOC family protein [Chloroflexota bacterium]|jgi:catechol 2,3-dioxygenase-like lactoylglutathione lyase family enzyme